MGKRFGKKPHLLKMPAEKRAVRRSCAFCECSLYREEMVAVTKNVEERKIWIRKLGTKFSENCEKTADPMVCLSHFPPKKATNRKSKVAPYKVRNVIIYR